VLDRSDFDSAVRRLEEEAPQHASALPGKAAARPAPAAEEESPSLDQYVQRLFGKKRFQVGVLVFAAGALAVAVFLSVVLFFQFQSMRKEKLNDGNARILLQQRLDSLSNVVKQQEEEQRLLDELERDATKETKVNNAKKK